jgi:hypothetical protein
LRLAFGLVSKLKIDKPAHNQHQLTGTPFLKAFQPVPSAAPLSSAIGIPAAV